MCFYTSLCTSSKYIIVIRIFFSSSIPVSQTMTLGINKCFITYCTNLCSCTGSLITRGVVQNTYKFLFTIETNLCSCTSSLIARSMIFYRVNNTKAIGANNHFRTVILRACIFVSTIFRAGVVKINIIILTYYITVITLQIVASSSTFHQLIRKFCGKAMCLLCCYVDSLSAITDNCGCTIVVNSFGFYTLVNQQEVTHIITAGRTNCLAGSVALVSVVAPLSGTCGLPADLAVVTGDLRSYVENRSAVAFSLVQLHSRILKNNTLGFKQIGARTGRTGLCAAFRNNTINQQVGTIRNGDTLI